MTKASWALQKAIHHALAENTDVLAQLGGPHIYDDIPRGAAFPYVTFGITSERDWSTASEDGGEHIVTLHVWSKAAGRQEAESICDAMRTAIHDQSLALTDHRLINLRQEFAETRRQPDDEIYHGIVRLRAVTEPQA